MHKQLLILSVIAALSGCQSARDDYNGREFDDEPTMTPKEYVDLIREAAMEEPNDPEFPLGVGLSPGTSSFNFTSKFKLEYVDLKYVSFRAVTENEYGCGHSFTVTVGTIDRASGKILGVRDFVSYAKWGKLKKALHDAADKELRRRQRDPAYHASGWTFDDKKDTVVDMLDGEVEVIENFYYAKDGLHFVYNKYEIACGWMGDVEVVIDPKTL